MKPIGILQMAGNSGPFKRTIIIPGGAGSQNLRTLANAAGYDGTRDVDLTFIVLDGTTLNGGIVGGAWPEAQLRTIALNIAGSVHGAPGVGGSPYGGAGNAFPFAQSGSAGGDAINCTIPMQITLAPTGTISGAGGGGGGGGGWALTTGPIGEEVTTYGFGGQGGNGFPLQTAGGLKQDFSAGNGGNGGAAATAGNPGSPSTKGGAATNYGPGNGGAAGWAIRKNGQNVPVVNNGIIVGTQA